MTTASPVEHKGANRIAGAELIGAPVQNDDGIGGEHIYMPRFNHRDGRKRDYLRGYGMQFWGIGAQGAGFGKQLPGFGVQLKQDIKKRFPAVLQLHPYGEVLPQRYNRVTVEGTSVEVSPTEDGLWAIGPDLQLHWLDVSFRGVSGELTRGTEEEFMRGAFWRDRLQPLLRKHQWPGQ